MTLEIKGLSRAAVESALPDADAGRLPLVGPLSVIRLEEVTGWREKYELSDDVDIEFRVLLIGSWTLMSTRYWFTRASSSQVLRVESLPWWLRCRKL